MKATLKIEAIGDNSYQMVKFYNRLCDDLIPGLGDAVIGKPASPLWVAEITGKHPKFKLERQFLHGRKDYSHSNSKGSRGVYLWYLLESGKVYEVKEPVSWKRTLRYFCKVTDTGDIERLTLEEVETWINAISASASTPPPNNA